jgi:hypothetical protein
MRRLTGVDSFVAFLCLFGTGHAAAVEFQKIDPLGVQYKTEIKINASEKIDGPTKQATNFFETTITLNNTENAAKNLIICTFGYSKKYDEKDSDGVPVAFRRTQIDMTFDADKKVLGCMLSQKQEDMKHTRIGHMGCRQITLDANQQGLAVKFVSGNKRTTIKKMDAKLQIDQLGPVQDGLRTKEKVIAAGPAGSGGHPLTGPHTINGQRPRMRDALDLFYTRLILSDDADVKLDTDATTFNCNKCFGMGSTLGDPDETRTDFILNLPPDPIKNQAKLKVSNQYDNASKLLLAAGGKAQRDVDLINESDNTAFVTITIKLVELPSACTAQLLLPEPQPISLPPRDSKTATLEVDCSSDLPAGAAGDFIFSMNSADTSDVLANYWIKALSPVVCDLNLDGQVDSNDIDLVMTYRNTPAYGFDDPFDIDRDGMITVNDARVCVSHCTNAHCAP